MIIVEGPQGGTRIERRIVREAVADRAWLPFSRPKARIYEREEIVRTCEPLTIVVAAENDGEHADLKQWMESIQDSMFSRPFSFFKRNIKIEGNTLVGAFPIENEAHSLKYKLSLDRYDPVPRI